MAYNFLCGDRDQPFLLPPDLRDWLPADHLAWFVLDVVDQLDLDPFLCAYRADGHGHPAYDPKSLLGVLLYAYATGVRSSRQIQRRCTEDLAFRVLAGNQAPDHVTIARFRVRHQQALAGFLVESLRLCAAAGLVRLGLRDGHLRREPGSVARAGNGNHHSVRRRPRRSVGTPADTTMTAQPPAGPPQGWQPPPPGQPPQRPPRKEKSTAYRIGETIGRIIAIPLMIVLALAIASGLVAIFRALTDNDEKGKPVAASLPPTAAPTTGASATAAPATSEIAPTTARSTPTTKAKPVPVEQQVKDAVLKALGESNRNVERLPEFSAPRGEYIVLKWAINENLTEGLTKDSARLDATKILKAIKEVEAQIGNHYTGAFLKGTYLLVDKYGNESEEVVVRAGYDKATINRINFENVYFKDIFELADRGSVHPAFQY
jgi:transposase